MFSPRLNRFRSRPATRLRMIPPGGRIGQGKYVKLAKFSFTQPRSADALRPYIKSLIEFSAVAPNRREIRIVRRPALSSLFSSPLLRFASSRRIVYPRPRVVLALFLIRTFIWFARIFTHVLF